MDPQVVDHHHHPPALALVLQGLDEVHEEVGVVVLHEDLEVHEAPLPADGTDYSYRWPPTLDEGKLHPRSHPAPAQLLPEMEGGLVDVDDLVVHLLLDDAPQLLHEIQLLLLQGVLLCEALPVCVVRPDILDFEFDVVSP